MFSSFGKKLAGKDRELKKIFYYNVKQELQGKIKIPEEQKKFLKSLEKIDNLEVKLGIWKAMRTCMPSVHIQRKWHQSNSRENIFCFKGTK